MPFYYRFYRFCQQLFALPQVLRFCQKTQLPLWLLAWGLIVLGLAWGLWFSPADYKQGDAYRIIFVHVPSAAASMGIYVFMAFNAIMYLIYQQKLAAMLMQLAAPIGAIFTAIALVTGSLWGHRMWGTWWEWTDARLISELILFFMYIGFIAISKALPANRQNHNIAAVLLVVGIINIPIIHYSVVWWNSLHQGATLFKAGAPNIAMSMLAPLLLMLLAVGIFFAAYMVSRVGATLWQLKAHR